MGTFRFAYVDHASLIYRNPSLIYLSISYLRKDMLAGQSVAFIPLEGGHIHTNIEAVHLRSGYVYRWRPWWSSLTPVSSVSKIEIHYATDKRMILILRRRVPTIFISRIVETSPDDALRHSKEFRDADLVADVQTSVLV